MDRLLDTAVAGPFYLRQSVIAKLMVSALQQGQTHFHRYQLHAFGVMPNHVHMLVTPHVVSTRWLGPLKGFTAREANQILGIESRPFWQDESYDHLVRSSDEFAQIRRYIEGNPVKAGLAQSPDQFRRSSAAEAA